MRGDDMIIRRINKCVIKCGIVNCITKASTTQSLGIGAIGSIRGRGRGRDRCRCRCRCRGRGRDGSWMGCLVGRCAIDRWMDGWMDGWMGWLYG